MTSRDPETSTQEDPVAFPPWPFHLPVLNPSRRWIEAEEKLVQQHAPSAFSTKFGIALDIYQSISKDLKDPDFRAVARASYRAEHLIAAYRVIKQINRDIRDPEVKMSTDCLAYAVEETADMNDETFEVWALRQGTEEKYKNVVEVLRNERQTDVQRVDPPTNQYGPADAVAECCRDEEDDSVYHHARAPSPSSSEAVSTSSWTVLEERRSQSDDDVSIYENDTGSDIPEESTQLAGSDEGPASQASAMEIAGDFYDGTTFSAPPATVSCSCEKVEAQQGSDTIPELENGQETEGKEIDGLQTEVEYLQTQVVDLERTISALTSSKEKLQGLNEQRELQLKSCKAETEALRGRIHGLEVKVKYLRQELVSNAEARGAESQTLVDRCDQLNKELAASNSRTKTWQQHCDVVRKHLFEAHTLNVDSMIEQEFLNYYNQELKDKYTRLRECLENLWQNFLTVKGDACAEQLDLEQATDGLLEENEVLQLQCQTLEDAFNKAVANSEAGRSRLEDLYEAAKATGETLQNENESLSKELAASEAECTETKLQLNGQGPGSQADIVATAGERAEVTKENARLKGEVQGLEERLTASHRERETLDAENEALDAEVNALDDEIRAAAANCEELEVDNYHLETEIERLRDDMQCRDTKIEELEHGLCAFGARCQNLKARVESLKAEKEELKTEREALKVRREEHKVEKEELKAEKMNLEGELTAVREQCEDLSNETRGVYEDNERLIIVIEGLRAENMALRKENEVREDEVEQARAAEANLHDEIGRLREKSEVYGDKADETGATNASLEARILELDSANDVLEEKRQALDNKVVKMRLASEMFRTANGNLYATNKELKSEIATLQDTVQGSRIKNDELEDEVRALKKDEALRQKDHGKGMEYFAHMGKKTSATIAHLEKQLDEVTSENRKLVEEKKADEKREQKVARLIEGLHGDHGRLIDELEKALLARDSAEGGVEELAEKIAVLEWKLEAARDKVGIYGKYLPGTGELKASDLEKMLSDKVVYSE